MVTFPAREYHCPLAGTKLYCLVTEACVCEQLAQSYYPAAERTGIELATSRSLVRRPTTILPSHTSTKLLFHFGRLKCVGFLIWIWQIFVSIWITVYIHVCSLRISSSPLKKKICIMESGWLTQHAAISRHHSFVDVDVTVKLLQLIREEHACQVWSLSGCIYSIVFEFSYHCVITLTTWSNHRKVGPVKWKMKMKIKSNNSSGSSSCHHRRSSRQSHLCSVCVVCVIDGLRQSESSKSS